MGGRKFFSFISRIKIGIHPLDELRQGDVLLLPSVASLRASFQNSR